MRHSWISYSTLNLKPTGPRWRPKPGRSLHMMYCQRCGLILQEVPASSPLPHCTGRKPLPRIVVSDTPHGIVYTETGFGDPLPVRPRPYLWHSLCLEVSGRFEERLRNESRCSLSLRDQLEATADACSSGAPCSVRSKEDLPPSPKASGSFPAISGPEHSRGRGKGAQGRPEGICAPCTRWIQGLTNPSQDGLESQQ